MGMVVNCAAYIDGRKVGDIALDDIDQVLEKPDHFVWVGLHEPDEAMLAKMQEEFGLHELAVEDAHHAHQRPKIEEYGNSLFLVLRTGHLDADGRVELGETHVFLGPRYVLVVRHGPSHGYTEVRARCESAPHLLAKGPGFVLYALMDFVVDQYFPMLDALEDSLEALEDEIFGGGPLSRDTTQRIYDMKRDLVALKRAVSPLSEVCNRLARFDAGVIHADTRPYFRDVYDHVIRINEAVDVGRELLTNALEANLSLVSVRQNEVMKKLAAWAAILAAPTAIAGIYGMNFQFMPELHWRYGYPAVMAAITVICGTLYAAFRRAEWL